jgi:peptide/nickel transport system substrate-binding protein
MFRGMLNKLGKNRISKSKGGNVMRKLLVVLLALTLLAACAPATPQVVEKEVVVEKPVVETVVVEKEKLVKETVVVEATPAAPPPPPEVDEEHTLTVAVSGDYGSLDWIVGGFFLLQNEARKHIFGRLNDYGVKELPDGTLVGDAYSTEPVLAESIEISEDGLVHTLHIPQGLKHYPSGNEVTAFDWWWYAKRWSGLGRLLSETVMGGYATEDFPMWGYRVVDKYTVQFVARHWTPIVKPLVMWHLVADSAEYLKHATADDPWSTEWADKNMVGCGEYFIADRVPGEYTTFLANPYYPPVVRRGKERGFEPFFKKIVFRIVPSEADRFMLLKAGEVDIAWDLSPKMINDLKKAEGVKVSSTPRGDMVAMLMHNSKEPFDDVRVRRAVSYMVPYQDIIDKVYFGLATPTKSPVPSIAEGSDYSHWPYDVPEEEAISKAKALLAEAGYPDGLEFELAFDMGEPAFEQIAKLIQGQMAKAGIKVNLKPMPKASFTEQSGRGQLTAFLRTSFPYVPEASYYHAFLYDCSSVVAGTYIDYCNKEADELVAQASREPDEAKRNELYSEAQRLLIEDAPWVWICARNMNRAMRDDIQGFIEYPDNRYRYQQLWRE